MSLNVFGLGELISDLLDKASSIGDEARDDLLDGAEVGVQVARDRVRRLTGETADSISASPARDGVAAEWGPTTKQGRLLETGTSRMGPFPYLEPSLEAAARAAEPKLSQTAGDL